MAAHLPEGVSQIPSISREVAFHTTAHVLQMAIVQGATRVVFSSEIIIKLVNADLKHFADHFKAVTETEEVTWVINGLDYAETFLGSVEHFPEQFCEVFDGLPFKVFLDEQMLHDLRIHPAITHGAGSFFVAENNYDYDQPQSHDGVAIWENQLQQQAGVPDAAVGPVSSSPSSPASVSGKAKIKRPPNAFILFRQAHHAQAVQLNPGLHNNQISKILGDMWQRSNEQTRAIYRAMAAAAKAEHLRLHPEYRYRPRKSSEKKRRMSKKKKDALLAQGNASGTTIILTDTANYATALEGLTQTTVYKNSLPEDFDEHSENDNGYEATDEDAFDGTADLAGNFDEDF